MAADEAQAMERRVTSFDGGNHDEAAPRLSRPSGSFPVHAMRLVDLARGAVELVAADSPAAVALAEIVRRVESGELIERCLRCGCVGGDWCPACES